MCRNIRTLFNFEPPATEEEIRASASPMAKNAMPIGINALGANCVLEFAAVHGRPGLE